jgi:predicted metallopeptidase
MGRKKNVEKEEKSYSNVPEAETIIAKLVERYPKVLFAVNPKTINVFGVDNAERPSSNNTMAKIKRIDGSMKALLDKHNVQIQFIIELYWSDWNQWSQETKTWTIFHELLHIPAEEKGLIKHDVQDFAVALSVAGIDGYLGKGLPNLLEGEVVKFREDLIAKMHMTKGDLEDNKADDAPTPPE